MFNLSEKYQIDRRILKCEYIRDSPSGIGTTNTPNSQTYVNIPRGDSVESLLSSRLRLKFDVLHAPTNNRYVDGNDIKLVKLAPVASFSTYNLTTSRGNYIEEISHANIV